MHTKKVQKISSMIIGILLALIFVFPIFILVINSFKTLKNIYSNVLALPIGSLFYAHNYSDAFKRLDYIRSFANSLLITGSSTICILLFSSMAAWVLARYKTKTSTVIFMIFAGAMLIPFQCIMLPLVKLMGTLHLMNRAGLIFMNVGFASSFSIILFHGFIKNIPIELEEAAAIDGCGMIRTFFLIVLPLLKTIFVTVAILNVMFLWNDFLLPSLTINKAGCQTLPLKTYLFFGQFSKKWDTATAGLVMVMMPIIIFYISCQKYIVKGVIDGAVKG